MAETKLCGECKAEIPEDANKCMHCGSDQALEVEAKTKVCGKCNAVIPEDSITCSQCGGFDKPYAIKLGVIGVVLLSLVIMFSGGDETDKPQKTYSAEEIANKLCMGRVKAVAKFPSSVDYEMFSSTLARPMQGGGYIVRLAFESKNGFGNMIPQMASCEVKGGAIQGFSVSGR